MNPTFKIIDQKGRVHLPKGLRTALNLSPGDIVGLTIMGGKLALKKAIVLEDENMPLEAKEAYVEAVLRELPRDRLAALLELAARLNQEHKGEDD